MLLSASFHNAIPDLASQSCSSVRDAHVFSPALATPMSICLPYSFCTSSMVRSTSVLWETSHLYALTRTPCCLLRFSATGEASFEVYVMAISAPAEIDDEPRN